VATGTAVGERVPHDVGLVVLADGAGGAGEAVGERVGLERPEPVSDVLVEPGDVAEELDRQAMDGEFPMSRGADVHGAHDPSGATTAGHPVSIGEGKPIATKSGKRGWRGRKTRMEDGGWRMERGFRAILHLPSSYSPPNGYRTRSPLQSRKSLSPMSFEPLADHDLGGQGGLVDVEREGRTVGGGVGAGRRSVC